MSFDLIVLGGGIAGTTAAAAAAEKGLRVLLCSGGQLGGTCLHSGCVPAKVCLRQDFSDLAALCAARDSAVWTLQAGLAETLREKNVTILSENGVLSGKTDRFTVRCGTEIHTAQYVLLATGSEPKRLPGTRTPEEIFTAKTLPHEAVLLGGGAAGLETASFLSRMGAVVTLYEQSDRLLPEADTDISAALLRALRRKGIRIHLNTAITQTPQTETVICACGRVPRTDGVGLRSVGLSEIRVDAQMQTAVPGLYAAGDVLGVRCTAHAAMREAECAVHSMCGEADSLDGAVFPQTVFTDPPCAFVGETNGLRRAVVPLKSCGGYLAAGGDTNGVLVLAADERGTVRGLHICGTGASELLAAGCLLVQNRMSVQAVENTVFPHPTVSEALHTAAAKIIKGDCS